LTRYRKILAFACLVFFVVLTAKVFSWPWSKDMFRQPSIKPYEPPPGRIHLIPLPPNSIALGDDVAGITRSQFEAITANPLPLTPDTLQRGEKLFKTYCFPCHGMDGQGDGPVLKKGFYPVNLTSPAVQARTDGFIYAYIRYGGLVMMPSYREFVSSDEAWSIVHYVRHLQQTAAKGATQ
jgi:mono/diheme cytochrome c family protein